MRYTPVLLVDESDSAGIAPGHKWTAFGTALTKLESIARTAVQISATALASNMSSVLSPATVYGGIYCGLPLKTEFFSIQNFVKFRDSVIPPQVKKKDLFDEDFLREEFPLIGEMFKDCMTKGGMLMVTPTASVNVANNVSDFNRIVCDSISMPVYLDVEFTRSAPTIYIRGGESEDEEGKIRERDELLSELQQKVSIFLNEEFEFQLDLDSEDTHKISVKEESVFRTQFLRAVDNQLLEWDPTYDKSPFTGAPNQRIGTNFAVLLFTALLVDPPDYVPNERFGANFCKVGLSISGWTQLRRCMTVLAYYKQGGVHHCLRVLTHALNLTTPGASSADALQQLCRATGNHIHVQFHRVHADTFNNQVQVLTYSRTWQKLDSEVSLMDWSANGKKAEFFKLLYDYKSKFKSGEKNMKSLIETVLSKMKVDGQQIPSGFKDASESGINPMSRGICPVTALLMDQLKDFEAYDSGPRLSGAEREPKKAKTGDAPPHLVELCNKMREFILFAGPQTSEGLAEAFRDTRYEVIERSLPDDLRQFMRSITTKRVKEEIFKRRYYNLSGIWYNQAINRVVCDEDPNPSKVFDTGVTLP
jgi:hypothetical protein